MPTKKKLYIHDVPSLIADGIERDVVLQQRSESEAAIHAMLCYYTMSDDLRLEIELEVRRLDVSESVMIARIVEYFFARCISNDERTQILKGEWQGTQDFINPYKFFP